MYSWYSSIYLTKFDWAYLKKPRDKSFCYLKVYHSKIARTVVLAQSTLPPLLESISVLLVSYWLKPTSHTNKGIKRHSCIFCIHSIVLFRIFCVFFFFLQKHYIYKVALGRKGKYMTDEIWRGHHYECIFEKQIERRVVRYVRLLWIVLESSFTTNFLHNERYFSVKRI